MSDSFDGLSNPCFPFNFLAALLSCSLLDDDISASESYVKNIKRREFVEM